MMSVAPSYGALLTTVGAADNAMPGASADNTRTPITITASYSRFDSFHHSSCSQRSVLDRINRHESIMQPPQVQSFVPSSLSTPHQILRGQCRIRHPGFSGGDENFSARLQNVPRNCLQDDGSAFDSLPFSHFSPVDRFSRSHWGRRLLAKPPTFSESTADSLDPPSD